MGDVLLSGRLVGCCADRLAVRGYRAHLRIETHRDYARDSDIRNTEHSPFRSGTADLGNRQRTVAWIVPAELCDGDLRHRRSSVHTDYVYAGSQSKDVSPGAGRLDLACGAADDYLWSNYRGRSVPPWACSPEPFRDRLFRSIDSFCRNTQCLGRGDVHHDRSSRQPEIVTAREVEAANVETNASVI